MGSGSPQGGLGSALLWSPYALPVLHRAHVRADSMEEFRVRGDITEVAFGVQALESAHFEHLSWLYQLSSKHINIDLLGLLSVMRWLCEDLTWSSASLSAKPSKIWTG